MSKLIFTVASGSSFLEMGELATPLMKKYAEKVGADFLFDNSETQYPYFSKFMVYDLLKTYDRVMYIDIDILVRPDALDVFQIVPEGHFAGFFEGSWCNEIEVAIRREIVDQIAAANNMESNLDFGVDYLNAGVFVADKVHQDLFVMPEANETMLRNTSEQCLMSLKIKQSGMKTFHLPICFNSMPRWWSKAYLLDSYFVHYAGIVPVEERIKMMATDLQALQ